MKRNQPVNMAASVHHQLLAMAKERNVDFNNLLTRYALERLLYRMSLSGFASRFVLKGALLFEIWSTEMFRTTKDADFLLLGPGSVSELETMFREICGVEVEEDGLRFLAETITAEEIREDQAYQGVRVTLLAMLGVARIPVQVDIGLGDAVVPAPQEANFPTLLGLPSPRLASYTRESAIAEKFEAMVALGMPNPRMKDLFDIWALSRRFSFRGPVLAGAIEATFRRRDREIPLAPPLALTSAFSRDSVKQMQWVAFRRKSRLGMEPPADLGELMPSIAAFLLPPARSVAKGETFAAEWPPGGPWG